MDNKILFIRNVCNDELYGLTKFIPKRGDGIIIDGKNGMYGLSLLEFCFIQQKYQKEYDYIVFIDDDCKVLDEDLIYEIIDYCDEHDYDLVGVPDGNMIPARIHRYDVPNLFFTIFRTRKFKDCTFDDYESFVIPGLDYRSYDSCIFEPYYAILTYFVYKRGMKFLKLFGRTSMEDNISTILYFNKKDLCVHTWYSREFKTSKFQHDRILNVLKNLNY